MFIYPPRLPTIMNNQEKTLCSLIASLTLGGCQQDFSIIQLQKTQEAYEQHLDCPWWESFVQEEGIYGTDILWAIDKSGSMNQYTEEKIIDGITSMLSALPPLGWQIFMFALHPDAAYDQQVPLTPGATREDVEEVYNNMSDGDIIDEKGFEAVETFMENNGSARSLLRPDALLFTLFVSDEDDKSYYEQTTDEEAVDLFVRWYDAKQQHKTLSSIIITEDSTCDIGASEVGTRYISATNYFGGTIMEFCADSWKAGVRDVVGEITPYGYEQLDYTPLESSIRVFVDNNLLEQETDWRYDPETQSVFFENIPAAGSEVDIIYNIDIATTNKSCPSETL